MVTFDPEADATYVRVSAAEVVATRTVGELLSVDLDADGAPVGVELLKAPGAVTADDEAVVVAHYPSLGEAFDALRRTVTV